MPLSFAQRRHWFVDQLQSGTAAYNVPLAMRLTDPLNVSALEQSFTEIVSRHESLRIASPSVTDNRCSSLILRNHSPFPLVT